MKNLQQLKLDNQICFPVYALSREIVGRYRPLLDQLDITYPQYLVFLVLWEHQEQSVSQLGEKLYLDSGTLTPLLKRLEQKKLVTRSRSKEDERIVKIKLTSEGQSLQKKAASIPKQLFEDMKVPEEELKQLKTTIEKILTTLNQ
ncbi:MULTISPECIES: MarR family winged helix-turn-helix transcriptional regulator [Elizabethkingia]|uniref:MarR family winged helix-turn-helix transcriptional regulator n=1 Tax=Elizabethkingia TaxID=308865 RepID=UPI0021A842D5|nr:MULTISPECIES: MarR family transcriptional regulator [Elizabethkingia]MCT3686968.1 MarR family transcriptional regulator [Elizabethkingia anophelis]MCT3705007.1 MarR family transcriptional regulator [Elizabethkingia anophelis]MCT3712026.1 MarR family transcriptional regulator [Elizabethkingia anophelis]MCT3715585.1 MarR family transcriptional regulator [Elizabethkingia anophelis]MCT3729567.1 MarR family transcriptional regulator [Elizabethkingia anophelis]